MPHYVSYFFEFQYPISLEFLFEEVFVHLHVVYTRMKECGLMPLDSYVEEIWLVKNLAILLFRCLKG